MVFTTAVNFVRSRGPDEFWRKRKIFKLASHFIGRRRNCYSIAIRYVHRALVYATKGRKLKKEDMANARVYAYKMSAEYSVYHDSDHQNCAEYPAPVIRATLSARNIPVIGANGLRFDGCMENKSLMLWNTRLTAACAEHGISYSTFREGLVRSNILLNRKVLSELACWEPRTFKALTDVASERAKMDGLNDFKRDQSDTPIIITRGMLK